MVITFFGHSSTIYSDIDEKRLFEQIEKITKGDDVDFYLGGYGNFDALAKNCAKQYKISHPNARIIFVTPYLNKWLDERKDYIEKEYDEILYPELEQTPLKFAISKRNEWMVKQADYVFAYVNTHYGGAYNALLYAAKHNKPYMNLYSGDYELYQTESHSKEWLFNKTVVVLPTTAHHYGVPHPSSVWLKL